ncbi:hypothetical protein PoB_002620400 [Plakobranchus ocellatus]|uniref:SMB domain-containing protein n=1 Tax=Plakobranchus ocellatus TaxID=259542 RepID=A0AAV4A0H1_9GAST|nr:hypothetical protein PoB_002620400 [Plakobranchus ocellatus]
MVYCRPHQVFIVTLIIIAVSRLFDTADPSSASSNTSSTRDQSRAKVVTDRTGFSERQTPTNTLSFVSQPSCFPGNLRTCFSCVQPSCTSKEDENDKFNQSQPHITEGSDFIEAKKSSNDRFKESPTSLLNSREAVNTQSNVPNTTAKSFENKSDADIVESIQRVHHSFWPTGKINSALNSDQSIGNTVGPSLSTESETDFNYSEISISIEEDPLLRSYLNYNQVTESTFMGYENDIDLSLFTFTCQGRCGEKISFPCSCSATCFLYDTCCDNMAQDCPRILNEGRAKFSHIRTADITCSNYPIYIIETCPRSAKENDGQKDIDTASVMGNVLGKENTSLGLKNRFLPHVGTTLKTEVLNDFNSTDSVKFRVNTKSSIAQILIAALSNAPVTDSVTGVTFINRTIYDCHKMPESTALPWPMRLNYTFLNPTKLEDFHFVQELNEYQPDFNLITFKAHQCQKVIKKTCNRTANFGTLTEIFLKECEKRTAVVWSLPQSYYRNIFCALCSDGRHITEYRLFRPHHLAFKGPELHILMSLSHPNVISVKANNAFASGTHARLSWSTVKCSIQNEKSLELISDREDSESDSRTLCSVTCHHTSFLVRSDGHCKADHEALLALADDGLAPLCPAAIAGMARFVVCSLKKKVENLSTADFTAPSVSIVFDSRLKRNLYVVKLRMALPKISSHIFSMSEKNTISNIVLVARLAKAFKDYRMSRSLCSEKKKANENTDLTVIRSSTLADYASRFVQVDLAQGMKAIRGPRVDDQNRTTTVCAAPFAMIDYLYGLDLYCMDDHLYERDSTWLSEFRSSPCFRHLESLGSNEATTVVESQEGWRQRMLGLLHIAAALTWVYC